MDIFESNEEFKEDRASFELDTNKITTTQVEDNIEVEWTGDLLLEEALEGQSVPKENLKMAAALIDAAFSGRPYAKQMMKKGLRGARLYNFYHNLIWLRSAILIGLMILSFVERPSWCYRTDCSVPRDVTKVMRGTTPKVWLSGLYQLPFATGLGLELTLIVCLWLVTVLPPVFFVGFRDILLRPR